MISSNSTYLNTKQLKYQTIHYKQKLGRLHLKFRLGKLQRKRLKFCELLCC